MKAHKIWNYTIPAIALLTLISGVFLIQSISGMARDLVRLVLLIGSTVLLLRIFEKARYRG